MQHTGIWHSPVGNLLISASKEALVNIKYLEPDSTPPSTSSSEIIDDCIAQLEEYYKGHRTAFNLPLDPEGSDFDKSIWKLISEVPFGSTSSYKRLAIASGNVKNIRAVGGANGRNPIPIIVPCHRVIGEDGTLIGYAGGLWRKKKLLQHEGVLLEQLAFFDE